MSNNQTNLSLSDFEKIEDILYYDEPILSHLKKNNKDYLLYLVDTLESEDVFLLYDISEEELFNYLTRRKSLLNLLQSNENPIIQITQDFYGNTLSTSVYFSQNIIEDYLPNEKSFLEFNPTDNSYYKSFIQEYNNNLYLEKLRNDAFYIKFSSSSAKYGETIGLIELSKDFLTKISSSFKHFLSADFDLNFKDVITDDLTLKKIKNTIQDDLDYRIVDLNFGSFEMALAVDTVMKKNIPNKEISLWAEQVGFDYKNTVLDNNFNEEELNSIAEKYNEEDRRKIFKPIYDISKNDNYSLEIKDNLEQKYSKIKIKKQKTIDVLIPAKQLKTEPATKDLQIVQFTTVVDKNSNKKSIKIVNDFFKTTEAFEYTIDNTNFKKNGLELEEKVSFKIEIRTIKGVIHVSVADEKIKISRIYTSDDLEDIINKFTIEIYTHL